MVPFNSKLSPIKSCLFNAQIKTSTFSIPLKIRSMKETMNQWNLNGYNFYYYSNVQRSQYRGCVLHVVKRLLHDSSLKVFNREISTANCLVCLMCGNEYVNNNNNNNNNNKTHPIHINPLNMMDIKNRCCMDKNNANIVEFFMN